MPAMDINQMNLGITTYPVDPPILLKEKVEKEEEDHTIDPKLMAVMKKYKYNWRLDQLSKRPGYKTTPKFVAKPVELIQATPKKEVELDPDVEARCDQLTRHYVRILLDQKKIFKGRRHKKVRKNLDKQIDRAWKSIYYFYKYQEREQKKKKAKRAAQTATKPQKKEKGGKTKGGEPKKPSKEEIYLKLAQPKKVFGPPAAPPQQTKPVEEMQEHLTTLATPKYRPEPKQRELGKVNPDALTYEITEPVLKLATTIPKRYTEKPEIIIPGQVKRSALRYKATERIAVLATPRKKRENKQAADDEGDHWTISPNALKYKATPRILELAKPLERK